MNCHNEVEISRLSEENVWDLTEEEVFQIVLKLQNFEPGEREQYMALMKTAFAFMTVKGKGKSFRDALVNYGFKVFKTEDSEVFQGICKRKKP
jgi:hypothetical protein